MSQFSGAFTVEVDLDRLADEIADRVLARLHQAAREATHDGYQVVPPRTTAGSPIYDRTDPEDAR